MTQLLVIAGAVGKDAVLRRTQGGDEVLNFSLAVSNGKDRDGNDRPSTWFDCSLWGPRAEKLAKHVTKGCKLTLTGRPSARAHEGKAYLGITVNELTFMGGGERRDDDGGHQQQERQHSGQQDGYSRGRIDDSEVPF